MEIIKESKLKGALLIKPIVRGDNRGYFMESYNKKALESIGIFIDFVQDNESLSELRGTVRGLHYQTNPKAQTKLVRCVQGAILDVIVDIRKDSPTYGEWESFELSQDNHHQLLIPKGFAHGFITLTDNAKIQYKVDEYFSLDNDHGIMYDDETLNIDWQVTDCEYTLSEKDKSHPSFHEAENNFYMEGI